MKALSLRTLIALSVLIVVAGLVGTLLITNDLRKLSCRRAMLAAATSTQAACSELSKKFTVADANGTFSSDKRGAFQSALLEIILDHYEGVEGGFWTQAQRFNSYSYPTYDGSGRKTDVPPAEMPHIASTIQTSLFENHLISETVQGRREAIITTSCPISKTEAVWTMERVPLTTSATYESVGTKLWSLMALIGVLLLCLIALLSRWMAHLSKAYSATVQGTPLHEALAANDLGVELKAFAERAQTTEKELKDLHEKLNIATEHASRADRIRTLGEMAAGLAHDLREPLGTLRLKLENLERNPERKTAETLPVAIEQIDRLDRFVEMMLAMTRPFQLKVQTVDLKTWFEKSFEKARDLSRDKKIELYFDSDVESWTFDPFQMERALGNVLSNAIHFTPRDGSIVVRASKSAPDTLLIDVRDSGPGLPDSLKRTVFKTSRSERSGGSGLGLMLAREIVEAHGGTIEYLDSGAQGAWFRMEIPKDE